MKEPDFRTVAIIGLGLMGGSLALALRERRPDIGVIGIDRDGSTRAQAARHGIDAGEDLGAIESADVIVLATPVRTILQVLPTVGGLAKERTLILDLGSTKRAIVREMEALQTRVDPIGGHPMCGKESAGFEAADAALYRDALFILTPLTRTTHRTIDRAKSLIDILGARPMLLDAERHDRAAAVVSHLPFALAATLVNLTTRISGSDGATATLAAGGFRDTSRLAASDTQMMLDTLLTNRDNVAEILHAFSRDLDALADSIADGDENTIERVLDRASKKRREMFR